MSPYLLFLNFIVDAIVDTSSSCEHIPVLLLPQVILVALAGLRSSLLNLPVTSQPVSLPPVMTFS